MQEQRGNETDPGNGRNEEEALGALVKALMHKARLSMAPAILLRGDANIIDIVDETIRSNRRHLKENPVMLDTQSGGIVDLEFEHLINDVHTVSAYRGYLNTETLTLERWDTPISSLLAEDPHLRLVRPEESPLTTAEKLAWVLEKFTTDGCNGSSVDVIGIWDTLRRTDKAWNAAGREATQSLECGEDRTMLLELEPGRPTQVRLKHLSNKTWLMTAHRLNLDLVKRTGEPEKEPQAQALVHIRTQYTD